MRCSGFAGSVLSDVLAREAGRHDLIGELDGVVYTWVADQQNFLLLDRIPDLNLLVLGGGQQQLSPNGAIVSRVVSVPGHQVELRTLRSSPVAVSYRGRRPNRP